MSYSVFYNSVKLDVLQAALGSSSQVLFNQVWDILETGDFDPDAIPEGEYISSYLAMPMSAHEYRETRRRFLHSIIFNGKIYDQSYFYTPNDFYADHTFIAKNYQPQSYSRYDPTLYEVILAILMTDSAYKSQDPYWGGSQHYYLEARNRLQVAKFDFQAMCYWDYLCFGRPFENGITGPANYYGYLFSSEIQYLVSKLVQVVELETRETPIGVYKDWVFFSKRRDKEATLFLGPLFEAAETGRDLIFQAY